MLNQPMQMVKMKCSLPLEEHAMIRKVYDRSGRMYIRKEREE